MKKKLRLFVYGSLMKGHGAHAMLERLPGARRVGRAWVPGRLLDLGEYPGAVVENGSASRVHGELWEIDYRPGVLRELDVYEEYFPERPTESLFTRHKMRVHLERGTERAWIYVVRKPKASARVLAGGRWRSHGA